jgi:hypothetical protein
MELDKYQRARELGIEVMNKFPIGSPEYVLGQKCFAFAAERMREEQKVELVLKVGSLEEKIQFETSQPEYYL